MWDFDPDEWLFFVAAAIVVVGVGAKYYLPLISVSPIRKSIFRRCIIACIPLVAIVPTYIVLERWADAALVAGHSDYVTLFMLGSGAWVLAASWWVAVLGISVRDDAIERDNPAALVAVCGMLLGVGMIYALSNVGAGPTIWTTIIPAFAGTIVLAMMSLLIEFIGGSVAEAITIDRDVAAGLRWAGVMLCCGMILGRAAGGNWVSWDRTFVDLAGYGWPAVLLALAAGVVHRMQRPTAFHPRPSIFVRGSIPAALFVATGVLVVAFGKGGLHFSQW